MMCSTKTETLPFYTVCGRSIDGRCEEERCVVVLCSMHYGVLRQPRGFVGCSCGRRGEEGESRVIDIIENWASLQSCTSVEEGAIRGSRLTFL